MRRVTAAGDELFAEISLDETQAASAEAYRLHPVLVDAALQAGALGRIEALAASRPDVPFSFSGVRLLGGGGSSVRAHVRTAGEAWTVALVDDAGAPVLSIESVRTRTIEPSLLRSVAHARDALYEVQWAPLSPPTDDGAVLRVATVGEGPASQAIGANGERYRTLDALLDAITAGAQVPDCVVVGASASMGEGELAEVVHDLTERTLVLLQAWLASEQTASSKLVLVTDGAIAMSESERPNLAQAALPGLLRSARAEHPERFALLDLDPGGASRDVVHAALVSDEPEVAIRRGVLHAPRLKRSDPGATPAEGPDAGPWHVSIDSPGTLENLAIKPNPQAVAPLRDGQVRVAVHAAGLNFKDVVNALGLLGPGATTLGLEGAGVVLDVAPDVTNVAPGDRVMGVIPDAFGPVAVTDCRLLVRVPDGWSFVEAASVPAVFLTAYRALIDVAGLREGEAVLIHGAAGGVGMAALQLVAHIGAEAFATAHPDKWPTLVELGVDERRIASSRSAEFREAFLAATDGRGMDVVLDSLAGELVDASLDLLPRGGRFIEIGKTDVRDPAVVAVAHPGVRYQAFDLLETSPDRIGEILAEIVALFERAVLHHLPISTWDVRRAGDAFRFLRASRHTGKIVLRVPQPTVPDGTILITGGTGGIGALLARHLAEHHGARQLLLASRRGAQAPGADELRDELRQLGCDVDIVACDVGQRTEVERLLARVPAERPLTAVFHAAGTLDDGVLAALDRERLRRVMVPKVDAAIHLHELTRDLELSEFVLFSSAAGTLGTPGQANYASANTFLDALAQARRREGLPAMSLAFGLWDRATGMTGHLSHADGMPTRPLDMLPVSDELGLELIDTARTVDHPLLVPMRLDLAALRGRAAAGLLPSILSDLVRAGSTASTNTGGSLARLVAAAADADRDRIVVEFVSTHTAAVLGHASAGSIDAERPFKELGIDSLSAVELRNRLAKTSGVSLPATLVFDHPTPVAVAGLLRRLVEGRERDVGVRRRERERVDEPVAIVGMACRYPGGVRSAEDLWELVVSGRDAIGEFPTNRGWDLERLYDPDRNRRGTSYARHGGFLYDAGDFDADHFGISPREALATDPQQRLLLECAWEALEDAGIDPLSLRGSGTGVFAGAFDSDYVSADIPAELEGFRVTGGTTSVISGRVAYALGLEGPAVSVDTACSSSLVAMHLTCQALRGGDCDLALAGGVTVLVTPELFIDFSRQQGLSPDGRCRAFGAGANGTGFSDGVGVLVLERLSSAREKGHRVLAVVRGSAINQDGASNGLTAPNGPSQERVIRHALASAGLEPGDVDVVEAHGTATTLGDPIEATALIAAYGQERDGAPLRLGSLKSNIGHTQAAAGVGGVIKMVQALRHELLPATLYADEPSPHVDWSGGGVELLTEPVAWPAGERTRRAGVSSFGVSGTNAHVVLEEPPPEAVADEQPVLPELPQAVWLVSARSERALPAQAERVAEWATANPQERLSDVAFSLASTRAQLEHRAAVIGAEPGALLAGLRALASGGSPPEGVTVTRGRAVAGRTAFMFTGQGAQRVGMGAELLEAFPVYRGAFEAACAAFDPWLDCSLSELVLSDPHSRIDQTAYTQPALFSAELALYRLVESLGLRADYLIGHSIGELVAAHVAGVFSLEDAARLVAARGRLMGALPEGGAMVALEASEAELAEHLSGADGRLSLAAVNAPRAVVVSGERDAVQDIAERFERDGRRTTRLRVSHAFHSQLMDPMLAEFGEVAAALDYHPPQIPLVSNRTGALIGPEAMSAEYWVAHVRDPVRFADGVQTLAQAGVTRYLELGPRPVLTAAARQTVAPDVEQRSVFASALAADTPETHTLLALLGQAHVTGASVDWSAAYRGRGARRVALPTHAFQHTRYWLTPGGRSRDPSALGQAPAEHPLLDAVLPLAAGQGIVFTGRLSLDRHPWLADHVVMGRVLLPGTAFLELALHAAAYTGAELIEELTLTTPLPLDNEHAVAIQLTVSEPDQDGRRQLTIHSRPAGAEDGAAWSQHATGTLALPTPSDADTATTPPDDASEIDVDELYDRLERAGFEYGSAFQGVRRVWRGGEQILAHVELTGQDAEQAGSLHLHPALLEAVFQPAALLSSEPQADAPVAVQKWTDVRLYRGGISAVSARLILDDDGGAAATLSDVAGRPVASLRATLSTAAAREIAGTRSAAQRDSLLRLAWHEVLTPGANGARYAVLADAGDLAVNMEVHSDLGSFAASIEAPAPSLATVLADFRSSPSEQPAAAAARSALHRALHLIQAWLADDRLVASQLVFVTQGAVAAADGDGVPDLALAPLWGLVRSAQSEHPGRFVLVDLDGSDASLPSLPAAVAYGEPQVAVRNGRILVPRLARVGGSDPNSI